MSDRKISAAFYETLGSAAETVVPRTLPAMVPLPIVADWVENIEISTTWRTDVTQSITKDEEERRALLTRPVRQLSARLVGRSNSETHTLAQQAMNYAYSNAPAPIYCDQAEITGSSGATIYCDTRYKRFYLGQRVIIQSAKPLEKQADNLVQWATIQDVANNYVVLAGAPARVPAVGDLLIPCMDVQISTETSGSLIVDNLLQVKVDWLETAGPESLPASHPPLSYDNLKGLVAYAESTPVFDLPPNWIDGIDIAILRRADTEGLGKGTAIFAQGSPYHQFSLKMLARDRETAWAQQRFFDAMQGRCGQFYLLSFNDPWTLDAAPFPTTSACKILPIGSHEEIAAHFQHVAFIRANGEVVIRKIQSVVDMTTYYGITLATALPDTNFVAIRPAHLCRFNSDTYSVNWVTDTVAESTFEIVEIRTHSGTAFDYPSLLHFDSYRSRTTIELSNPNIWFDATSNSYSVDKETNYSPPNRKLAAAWPNANNEVVTIFDVREQLASETTRDWSNIKRPYLTATETSASLQPVLVRYSDPNDNAGKPAISRALYKIEYPNTLTNQLPRTQDLWSTANGWTLILSYCPHRFFPTTSLAAELVSIESTTGGVFRIRSDFGTASPYTQPRMEILRASGTTSIVTLTSTLIQSEELAPQILVVRYDTFSLGLGHIVQVFKNGQSIGSFSFSAGETMQLPALYAKQEFFRVFVSSASIPKTQLANWGNIGAMNSLLSYKRSLSNSEINNIAAALARTSSGTWTNLP